MTKVLWSFDPFAKDDESALKVEKVLRALGSQTDLSITPVNVMSPSALNWTGDFSGEWEGKFKPLILEAMTNYMQNLGLAGLNDPVVLVSPEASTHADVKKVSTYAVENSFDLIALSTHGRKGVSRLFLGSFAETLLLEAQTPLLTINPQVQSHDQIKKVVVPTDFSGSSQKVVERAAPILKDLGAEVVFFHKIPDLLEPIVQSGVLITGGGWVSTSEFFEHRFDRAEEKMKTMLEFAQTLGLQVSSEIADGPDAIVDSLNQYVENNKVDLVMMGARSSQVGAVVYGSLARGLIRSCTSPVWSLHV